MLALTSPPTTVLPLLQCGVVSYDSTKALLEEVDCCIVIVMYAYSVFSEVL